MEKQQERREAGQRSGKGRAKGSSRGRGQDSGGTKVRGWGRGGEQKGQGEEKVGDLEVQEAVVHDALQQLVCGGIAGSAH